MVMERNVKIDKHLKKMISIIIELQPVHSIYLIGTKKKTIKTRYFLDSSNTTGVKNLFTYTILIVSYNFIGDPKVFMNEVFNKSVEQIEIYSIHYTIKEAKRKLTEGDNFLSRIIINSRLIYQETDELEYLPSNYLYHPKIFQRIKTEWDVRNRRAHYFEEKLDVAEHVVERNGRYLLLQQSLIQSCLGILYVFWEYKPTYFSLPFLLQLCNQFIPTPEIIFPKRSFRSQRIYNDICHATYNLDCKAELDSNQNESFKAQNLCYKFLKKAESLAKEKLEELERLHAERSVSKRINHEK